MRWKYGKMKRSLIGAPRRDGKDTNSKNGTRSESQHMMCWRCTPSACLVPVDQLKAQFVSEIERSENQIHERNQPKVKFRSQYLSSLGIGIIRRTILIGPPPLFLNLLEPDPNASSPNRTSYLPPLFLRRRPSSRQLGSSPAWAHLVREYGMNWRGGAEKQVVSHLDDDAFLKNSQRVRANCSGFVVTWRRIWTKLWDEIL